MIFQPTNVTPDLLGGVENGVVYTQSGSGGTVTVSWQVNGNTPLYAYQIDFFQMDAQSTAAGSTGKVNVVPAFSGVDAYGNVQRYSVSVPYSLFSGAAVAANNYEGKFCITQWYTVNRDESVVQRSMSVFRLAAEPSVRVLSLPGAYGGAYKFYGTYVNGATPAYQPVTPEWSRWYVRNLSKHRIEQDTGKVYGITGVLEYWTTKLLNPGDQYQAVYTVGTNLGAQYSATSTAFTALEGYVETTGGITAVCDRKKGAVRLDVIPSEDFPAAVTGDFEWNASGNLVLPLESSAKWTPPSLSDVQWNFLWIAEIDRLIDSGDDTQLLFRVRQSNGRIFSADWLSGGQMIEFTPILPDEGQIQWMEGEKIAVLLSMKDGVFTMQVSEKTAGGSVYTFSAQVSDYTPGPIVSVEIGGGTTTDFWAVSYGPDDNGLAEAFANWETPASVGPRIWFYGENYVAPDEVLATAVYFDAGAEWTMLRRDESGNVALVTNIGYGETADPVSVWDYGAANGNTYTYYIVSQDSAEAQAYVTVSDSVSPCLWDWALIQAEEHDLNEETVYGGRYTAQQVFLFSANVSTGQTGNGNSPSVQSTFTRYPVVLRDTLNRQAGTLTGLIGSVKAGVYSDANATRDALWGLSTSPLPLFLRSRRGDFLRVAISGEITMDTADNSAKQQITATIPWVEIGAVEDTVSEYVVSSSGGGEGE